MAYKVTNRRKSKIDQIKRSPDGGWGWVIVMASMVGMSNWSAVSRCYSVFYIPLKRQYDTDFADVAWLNGLFQIGYGVSCTFAHVLIDRFGFRTLTMVSGFIAGFSIFIGSFASELRQAQLFTSLLPGICMGQVSVSCFTIVTRYFDKRLNSATQLMCVGITLGAFFYCPIYQTLIDTFSWRGAFQIIAGFFLNIGVVGSLMRPLVLKEDFSPELLEAYEEAKKRVQDRNNNVESEMEERNKECMSPERCATPDKDRAVGDDVLRYQKQQQQKALANLSRTQRIIKLCVDLNLNVYVMSSFYSYTFAWVLFAMAYFSTLSYLVPYGSKVMGLTDLEASSLVSALMAGELLSRMVYGVTMDRVSKSQRFLVASVVMLCVAAIFLVLPYLKSYASLLVGCAALGASGGGMDGLFSVFAVDLFGINLYAAVFGYANIIIHSLGMLATVLTGKCVDATGNLASAFYMGAGAAFLGAMFTLLMRHQAIKRMRLEEEDTKDSPQV